MSTTWYVKDLHHSGSVRVTLVTHEAAAMTSTTISDPLSSKLIINAAPHINKEIKRCSITVQFHPQHDHQIFKSKCLLVDNDVITNNCIHRTVLISTGWHLLIFTVA